MNTHSLPPVYPIYVLDVKEKHKMAFSGLNELASYLEFYNNETGDIGDWLVLDADGRRVIVIVDRLEIKKFGLFSELPRQEDIELLQSVALQESLPDYDKVRCASCLVVIIVLIVFFVWLLQR
jgi:hypothetical protein